MERLNRSELLDELSKIPVYNAICTNEERPLTFYFCYEDGFILPVLEIGFYCAVYMFSLTCGSIHSVSD